MYDDLFKKILIVEDDLSYRGPLNDFLSASSYTVFNADDGEQAMEKLLLHRPDVVILDLLLPKVHGFEVLKRIRSYPDQTVATTPVVILSNLNSAKDMETAKSMGVNNYFVKSQTNFETVAKTVGEILFKDGRRPAQDEILDFRNMG